ncbi:MAG: ABC transporter substrate-binding protein [Ktedonobacterales bacterium]
MVSPHRRVTALILSSVMLLTLALSACGSSSSGGSGPSGTLVIVPSPKGNFTANFNPFFSGGAANDPSFGMIYEPLMAQQRFNGTPPTPWLATSATWNSTFTEITFKLRTDVKWSDGTAFTAADVVYTFDLMKQYPALDTNGFWTTNPTTGTSLFNSVTALDSSTVQMTFNQNASVFEWFFAAQTPIVAQHTFSKMSDPATDLNSNPVGTGPYVLSSFSPSLITLTANPHYWQAGLPKIKTLKYPAFNSNTSAEVVLNDSQIDWAGVAYPNIKQWAASNPDNHYFYAPTNVVELYLNLDKAPFNDLAVRQAMSAAIDRNSIVNQGSWGLGSPASPTGVLVPEDSAYVAPQYANLQFGSAQAPSDNIAAAQQILTAAGYKTNSAGKYLGKDGKPITFDINVVSGWTDWDQIVAIMVQDLNQLGFTVTANETQYAQYYSALQTGQFDTAISWTNQGPSPYYPLYGLLDSVNSAAAGQQANPTNWERYSNSTVDSALQAFTTASSTSDQAAALAPVEQIMVTQMPVIVLYENFAAYEYRTTNFTGWPTASDYYEAGAPYEHPEDARVVLHLTPAK